jgi:hypothetical protein
MVLVTMHVGMELVAISVTAYLMIKSGVHKRLLERPRFGVCPSCGRERTSTVCQTCARR